MTQQTQKEYEEIKISEVKNIYVEDKSIELNYSFVIPKHADVASLYTFQLANQNRWNTSAVTEFKIEVYVENKQIANSKNENLSIKKQSLWSDSQNILTIRIDSKVPIIDFSLMIIPQMGHISLQNDQRITNCYWDPNKKVTFLLEDVKNYTTIEFQDIDDSYMLFDSIVVKDDKSGINNVIEISSHGFSRQISTLNTEQLQIQVITSKPEPQKRICYSLIVHTEDTEIRQIRIGKNRVSTFFNGFYKFGLNPELNNRRKSQLMFGESVKHVYGKQTNYTIEDLDNMTISKSNYDFETAERYYTLNYDKNSYGYSVILMDIQLVANDRDTFDFTLIMNPLTIDEKTSFHVADLEPGVPLVYELAIQEFLYRPDLVMFNNLKNSDILIALSYGEVSYLLRDLTSNKITKLTSCEIFSHKDRALNKYTLNKEKLLNHAYIAIYNFNFHTIEDFKLEVRSQKGSQYYVLEAPAFSEESDFNIRLSSNQLANIALLNLDKNKEIAVYRRTLEGSASCNSISVEDLDLQSASDLHSLFKYEGQASSCESYTKIKTSDRNPAVLITLENTDSQSSLVELYIRQVTRNLESLFSLDKFYIVESNEFKLSIKNDLQLRTSFTMVSDSNPSAEYSIQNEAMNPIKGNQIVRILDKVKSDKSNVIELSTGGLPDRKQVFAFETINEVEGPYSFISKNKSEIIDVDSTLYLEVNLIDEDRKISSFELEFSTVDPTSKIQSLRVKEYIADSYNPFNFLKKAGALVPCVSENLESYSLYINADDLNKQTLYYYAFDLSFTGPSKLKISHREIERTVPEDDAELLVDFNKEGNNINLEIKPKVVTEESKSILVSVYKKSRDSIQFVQHRSEVSPISASKGSISLGFTNEGTGLDLELFSSGGSEDNKSKVIWKYVNQEIQDLDLSLSNPKISCAEDVCNWEKYLDGKLANLTVSYYVYYKDYEESYYRNLRGETSKYDLDLGSEYQMMEKEPDAKISSSSLTIDKSQFEGKIQIGVMAYVSELGNFVAYDPTVHDLSEDGNKGADTVLIVLLIVLGLVLLVLLIFGIGCYLKKRKNRTGDSREALNF